MIETSELVEPTHSTVWPPIGAYILLSGGLTMAFLAASTLASSPALAIPGLLAPALVAFGLALQRGESIRHQLGEGVRRDVVALSAAFGPFVIVLALVLSSRARVVDGSWMTFWSILLSTLAELGWWGYLYPLLRKAIQPLPAALAVGTVHVGWLGLLAWADANPLAGASPVLLILWSFGLSVLTAAVLEFRPWSLAPVVLLHLGLQAAIQTLPFPPDVAGSSRPARIGVALITAFGLATMIVARSEAVARARHARNAR